MKLTTLTVLFAATSLAGAAVAQDMAPAATMQPIPNPPESASTHHAAHHMKHKAKKAKAAAAVAAPPAASPK
jgi:nitrate reductase cytochrome c-type subunit